MSLDSTGWENQRAFLAVLREGSLSAAARALGVAQPTVRRRLEALERAVGVALFTRSPTGLSPSEAARELATHAETMAAAADAFSRAASGGAGASAGVVRISASNVIGALVLPQMLAGLREMHPGLVFELSLTDKTEDLLRHEADIAVRMVQPTQAAIVATRVGRIALGLYARADYLARHGTPASLDELSRRAAPHASPAARQGEGGESPRFTLIGPDRDGYDLRLMRQHGLDWRRAMIGCRSDSHLAQLGAIHAGLGIGVCQKALAARDPSLVPVLPAQFDVGLETWVTMHEDLRRVQRIRTTFTHLVDQLAQYCASA